MIVRAIKSPKVAPDQYALLSLLDQILPELRDGSVLAITSKIVSLCENGVVPIDTVAKEELIKQEADRYLLLPDNKYGLTFTVTNHTLIVNAGVDESNVEGDYYLLWPANPQQTANEVRAYLRQRFKLQNVGVVITDSTARPLRWGMGGMAIARSGFAALHDYRGEADLYGRRFRMETGDISGGLAASAVLVMGEGAEQTPLAVLEDLPFVQFQDRDPRAAELKALAISLEDDLYGPILTSVAWQEGGHGSTTRGPADASSASHS